MMKYLKLLIASCFFLSATFANAQEKAITGRLIDAKDNTILVGVTITNQATGKKTSSTSKGEFTALATKGDVIIITYVGYTTQRLKVGDESTYTIRLVQEASELDEVVVAMDLKRKPRELGYSTQKVDGAEIQETQRENFINSLQGRVAGLTINSTSGTAGASSSIVLRGFNSLSLSNQPLFVIDGIIVDNQTVDENSDGGKGIGLASDRPNRNSDYSNRIADVNPNDIESVTILKGPEATALYGSQASSGAIVITTKKSKTNKLALQYDNSFRLQEVTRKLETFDDYAPGSNGLAQNIFRYFGPKYPDGTQKFKNIDNFFKTGFSQTHNIGADFGVGQSKFRFSGSYFGNDGVIPNNALTRLNLRLSNTTKIGKYLEIIPSFSYVSTQNKKVLRGAGGYLTSLYVWPSNNDIRNYESDAGKKIALFNSNPNSDFDNPLFNVNENRGEDQTERYTTTLGINIYPLSWLTLAGRFGYDRYNTNGYTIYHPDSYYLSANQKGQQDNYYRQYYGYNHTITATAKKTIGKFSGRLLGGTMWQDYETRQFAITGTNISSPDYSDSANTAPNTRIRLLQNNLGRFNKQITRQIAYFGEASLSYNNLIFLTYSHRFESASTLPEKNRNYNYPGLSASIIVSDILPFIKGSVLNYMKLRGSVAKTARLNSPYSTQSVFVNNLASGGGFSYGFTNNNPELGPERQSTYEVGTELKLFKNKLNLEATYYNTLNEGQIIENFRLSYATGFVLNTQNAGSTRNQGFELSADATLINQKAFGWNLKVNFAKMKNKVLLLPANVSEYYIADTWLFQNARGGLMKGGTTTSITSFSYLRNNNGDILISPSNGLPVVDQTFKVKGDRNPDFTVGFTNNFRYKTWRLNFLWDVKVGGDIFNATEQFLTAAGRSQRTADRFVPRVIKGVLNDGKQNSATPTVNTIAVIPAYNDQYYTALQMPEEEFIEKDVNWLRLRDITLSYAFPKKTISRFKGLKTLSFFVTGTDLILITNYTGADPAVNGNTAGSRGVGGFGFDFASLPAPIGINFGIKAGF